MKTTRGRTKMWLVMAAIWVHANPSQADAVTEWNTKAGDIVFASAQLAPQMYRTMAIVQAAVHDPIWARDYNEVKTLGARTGDGCTANQTTSARFWAAATPTLYFDLVRSSSPAEAVAIPGRTRGSLR